MLLFVLNSFFLQLVELPIAVQERHEASRCSQIANLGARLLHQQESTKQILATRQMATTFLLLVAGFV